MELAIFLREYRKGRKLSVRAFAEMLDVNKFRLEKWEKGVHPNWEDEMKIKRYFRVKDFQKLSEEFLKSIQATQKVLLKENLDSVGSVLKMLEEKNKKYLFVTASLYSNSFIKENQIHQLKKKYKINPMTISLGYFPITTETERDSTFRCSTEDKSGASDWGCALVNKARGIRRKFDPKIQKPWAGVMDLTGEKDYMLLLRKK